MLENNQKEIILLEDLGMQFATETSKEKKRYGLFKCYCGNEFKVRTADIKSGRTKSCGCLYEEKNTKHGLRSHRLYGTWKNIVIRCCHKDNKSYKNYGGRGITVCSEWLDIENFINDMYPSYKEGLSIDRINNDLGYSKDNCRWANQTVQNQNTRRTRSTNNSGYRGVGFFKSRNKFRARISVNYKEIHLGYFKDSIEAAKAYDRYIIENNLEHTRNFN